MQNRNFHPQEPPGDVNLDIFNMTSTSTSKPIGSGGLGSKAEPLVRPKPHETREGQRYKNEYDEILKEIKQATETAEGKQEQTHVKSALDLLKKNPTLSLDLICWSEMFGANEERKKKINDELKKIKEAKRSDKPLDTPKMQVAKQTPSAPEKTYDAKDMTWPIVKPGQWQTAQSFYKAKVDEDGGSTKGKGKKTSQGAAGEQPKSSSENYGFLFEEKAMQLNPLPDMNMDEL